MCTKELHEEGVAPPSDGEDESPQIETPGQDLPRGDQAQERWDAPDAGEIEWAGGLIKRHPGRNDEPRSDT